MSRSLQPVRWEPPRRPERVGALAPDTRLSKVEHLPVPGEGPEDVAIADDGTLYTGVDDGRIFALDADGANPKLVCDTGGRPIGIEVDRDGSLVVCDAVRGVLRVNVDAGEAVVLTDSCDGRRFGHVNNASIDQQGRIYFSDPAPDWPLDMWIAAIYENRPTGALYRYDPATATTEMVAHGFAYGNGVAVSPDGSFVLIAETARCRIHRVWLTGPSTGSTEMFCENLPGFPDNISVGSDGRFWAAIPNGRDAFIDRMWLHPRMRALAFRLPEALRPKEKPFSMVLGFDASGEVIDLYEDPDSAYPFITGVREGNGYLYLGSIHARSLGRVPL